MSRWRGKSNTFDVDEEEIDVSRVGFNFAGVAA